MKNILACLIAAVIFAASGQIFHACGQNAAPTPAATSAEQAAAKLKQKWTKALEDARHDFLNSNDRESAEFVGNILAALEQPDGMSPAALAANAERIKKQVRDLVRRGAMESAARLNWAQCAVLFPIRDDAEPVHPNHKTGGTPGPGGLVLYLPFDAPDENGVIHDASGAGNDGSVYGAKWIPEGKFGGAYQFRITNVTDRIVIPNSDLLNPGYITVSAWIKTTDTDGFFNRIVDKGCDEKSYTLCLGGDWEGKSYRGQPLFELSGRAAFGPPAGDGRWHHVAGTYDGQVNKLYLDGVERGQDKGHHGPIGKNNWDLCVGNNVIEDAGGEFLAYDGLIDEVRVYNRALSADEIKMLATATHAGVDVVPAPSGDNSGKPDAAERLKKVKSLFDQGLINKEDYDKKVKEIMDSL